MPEHLRMRNLFTRYITQNQGAEALAALVVVTSAQAAQDYLKEQELSLSGEVSVTSAQIHQTVVEFLLVVTYYFESYTAGQYSNRTDLSRFFSELESGVYKEYMKLDPDVDPVFNANSFGKMWQETLELYSSCRRFYASEFPSKDSVSGEFSSRVAAIFGESRYSFASAEANIAFWSIVAANEDCRTLDTFLSRIDWSQRN